MAEIPPATHASVAYTNLAKCRTPLGADNRSRKLAELCQEPFPISVLVKSLQPKVVLVATTILSPDRYAPVGTDPQVICWEGQNYRNADGRPRTEWLRFEAGSIRRKLG